MADLIDLNRRRPRGPIPPARLDRADGPGATILFFTGVRYERLAEPPERIDLTDRLDGAPSGSRRKGKRRA